MLLVLASAGLPGLCGFIGEFLVLSGTFTAGKDWQASGPGGSHVRPSGAAGWPGRLRGYPRRCLSSDHVPAGDVDKPENRDPQVRDLGLRERLVFGVLVLAALVMGVAPQPILESTRRFGPWCAHRNECRTRRSRSHIATRYRTRAC